MSAGNDLKNDIDEKENLDIDLKNVEDVDQEGEAQKVIAAEHDFTPEEYKKLLRKIDLFLMPLLMIAYGLQYIDKTSLSSGAIFGLKEETHLKGNEYANLTLFFYMAYFFAQIPMSWILQKLPFGRTLSICVIIWGGCVMCLAACGNYSQLVAVRFLIGWFESVVTPAFAILTTSWYLRNEQTLRQGIYYSMNHFVNIVMSVGIYKIADYTQKHGTMSGWRVINLFLGGTTVAIGLLMVIFIGNPGEVWWLSKREKLMAHARIVSNSTGGSEQHPWKWEQVRECLRDRQFWHAMAMNFFSLIPNGALTTFQFIIFQSFGFTSLQTILYSLPMFGINFVLIVSASVCIRYYPHTRFPIAIFTQIVGVAIWLFVGVAPDGTSRWARWGTFLFCHTFVVSIFILWPLMSVNVAGRTKKSFLSAMSLMSYCVGNTVGSQIFLPRDAPGYRHGLVTCAIVLAISVVNTSLWWRYYVSTNRKREEAFIASGISHDERELQLRLAGENDLTDIENPHFRYSC